MKTEQIFCDVCGTKFTGGYWDMEPSELMLWMGGPGANQGKRHFQHTCFHCRHGIYEAVDNFCRSRAPKPPEGKP